MSGWNIFVTPENFISISEKLPPAKRPCLRRGVNYLFPCQPEILPELFRISAVDKPVIYRYKPYRYRIGGTEAFCRRAAQTSDTAVFLCYDTAAGPSYRGEESLLGKRLQAVKVQDLYVYSLLVKYIRSLEGLMTHNAAGAYRYGCTFA